MIKINLLGKKKAKAPFGLDEVLGKLGIGPDELVALRPALMKAGVIVAAMYASNLIPSIILQKKSDEVEQTLKSANQRLLSLQTKSKEKKEISKQMDELLKQEGEVTHQLKVIDALSKDRSLAFHAVDTVITVLPDQVWLNKYEYKDGVISLSGSSWDYFPINDFMKALNEITQFQDVMFKGITAEAPLKYLPGIPPAVQKLKNFDVNFTVKGSS